MNSADQEALCAELEIQMDTRCLEQNALNRPESAVTRRVTNVRSPLGATVSLENEKNVGRASDHRDSVPLAVLPSRDAVIVACRSAFTGAVVTGNVTASLSIQYLRARPHLRHTC